MSIYIISPSTGVVADDISYFETKISKVQQSCKSTRYPGFGVGVLVGVCVVVAVGVGVGVRVVGGFRQAAQLLKQSTKPALGGVQLFPVKSTSVTV